VRTALSAIDITVEELKPKYMRGYGAVPDDVAVELNGIVGELCGLVSRLDGFLAQGAGQDLHARLQRLETTSDETALLSRIEQVVAGRGLVEFRTAIDNILDRLEDKSFEIAVFGRVSSGKSSLLDAILETRVLPVGITPITAVPTRILFGKLPTLTVWYAERPSETCDVSRLAEYVTEQQNPGNRKNVARIVVRLPSARLRDGISFMDTPGLGSLATSGAAQTVAYLPKCDLGVVLVDSASTLTPDDLSTIGALLQAAIPVQVLLSKADLLAPEDVDRLVGYVSEHLETEFRMALPVHSASVLPAHRASLDQWFSTQIAPLYERALELRTASMKRKIGALRESVLAALEARLARRRRAAPAGQEQVRAIEARLREATGGIEQTATLCERACERIVTDRETTLRAAVASALAARAERPSRSPAAEPDALHEALLAVVREKVAPIHRQLLSLAGSLETELAAVAGTLAIPDAPAAGELASLLRETPLFEFAKSPGAPLRSPLAGLFGKTAAERSLAARLAREIGAEWEQSLRTYFALLRHWCEHSIAHLKRHFDAYADAYRAHAERSLGSRELTGEEESGILQDIAALGETARGEWRPAALSKVPD
jgi:GTP-binding protein EngB required for normal cell division